MKNNKVKTFDMMTNIELKRVVPLSKINQEQWKIEMEKRGLYKASYTNKQCEAMLRTSQAAKLLGMSRSSLFKKLRNGGIKGIFATIASRKEWRIPQSEIDRILKK